MPTSNSRRWLVMVTALVMIVTLSLVTLGSIYSVARHADRTTCEDRVHAELNAGFRHDVGDMLDGYARGDLARAARAVARIKDAPDDADAIDTRCH